MKRVSLAVALVCAATVSCVEEHELAVSEADPAPIIGGIPDLGHENVVMLRMGGFLCTGTLVADRVVLTAAHCVDGANSATVIFGTSEDDPDAVSISAPWLFQHRYYDPATIGIGLPYDIAMIRMSELAPVGIDPMPMNLDPLSDSIVGANMLAVGYGNDDGTTGTGAGIKRRALLPINSVGAMLIGMGNDDVNTCQGDSGGPGLFEFDGVEHVIGITSTGPQGCVGNSHQTRLDIYRDSFVIPILDAWTGPCQFDGECVTEGCRTPDPDCDPCGVDTFCARGCEQLDLDCPVTGFAGDLCSDDDDCESRFCVEAHDDSRVKYCSNPCDPGAPIEDQCEPPLGQCGAFNGGPVACHFVGPSRSAQGWACSASDECRSGVCDPDDDICIEQCGDGKPECAEGYSCEDVGSGVKACRVPSGGCGCSAGSRRNGGDVGALLLVAGAVIFARRRRARARHS